MEKLMFYFILHVGFVCLSSRTHLHLEGGLTEIIKNKNKNCYLPKGR